MTLACLSEFGYNNRLCNFYLYIYSLYNIQYSYNRLDRFVFQARRKWTIRSTFNRKIQENIYSKP